MITVSDIEYIRRKLLDIFPDAVRGSVAKSKWGNGRRQLHLAYFIGSDTVGGYMVEPMGNLYYFNDWDTNTGRNFLFAESDIDAFVDRIRREYGGQQYIIDRCVVM
jgi:hypothetical protein